MRHAVWRVAAALLFVGVLCLATPPRAGWPFALVALVPLLLAIRVETPRRAALLGWVAGAAYYLISCTWWYTVLHRAFALPVAVCLLLYLLFNL